MRAAAGEPRQWIWWSQKAHRHELREIFLARFAEKKYGETRLWYAEPNVPDAIDEGDVPEATDQSER